jgi:hypothetical protein
MSEVPPLQALEVPLEASRQPMMKVVVSKRTSS